MFQNFFFGFSLLLFLYIRSCFYIQWLPSDEYQYFLVFKHDNNKKIIKQTWKCYFNSEKKIMEKGSKCGLYIFFGPILRFYSKNSPGNSLSLHFMIALWNQKSQNVGTSCIKLERLLLKNQDAQRKLLNFKIWCDGEVSKSAKISHAKLICYVKNDWNQFSKFNNFL